MLRNFKAVAAAAAMVASLAMSAGTAHASAAQAPAVDKCDLGTHTFEYNGYYLEARGYGGKGAVVDTWEYADQSNERWCLETAWQGGYYLHPAYNQSLCLDVPGGDYHAGAGLVIWSCNGGENQRFGISAVSYTDAHGLIWPIAAGGLLLTYGGYHGQITLGGWGTYWQ